MAMARLGRGHHRVPQRRRPLRIGPAPRDRHRRTGRRCGAGGGGGRDPLRRNGGLFGTDGQRPNRGRLRHLVPPPVRAVGARGQAGVGGRPAGRGRHDGHPLGRRPTPALRRPHRGIAARLPRPAAIPATAPGRIAPAAASPAPAPEAAPAPPARHRRQFPAPAPRPRDAPHPAPLGRRAPRPAPLGRRAPRPAPLGRPPRRHRSGSRHRRAPTGALTPLEARRPRSAARCRRTDPAPRFVACERLPTRWIGPAPPPRGRPSHCTDPTAGTHAAPRGLACGARPGHRLGARLRGPASGRRRPRPHRGRAPRHPPGSRTPGGSPPPLARQAVKVRDGTA